MTKNIGMELLRDLSALASHASDGIFDRRKMSYGYEAYMDHVRFTERQVAAGLRRLEKSGFVEVERGSRRIRSMIITEQGLKRVFEEHIRNEKGRYLLGRYCQVAFDIPEADRDVRRKIRRLLKTAGFKKSQRSIWVTTNKIHKLLSRYFKKYYPEFEITVSLCRVVEYST